MQGTDSDATALTPISLYPVAGGLSGALALAAVSTVFPGFLAGALVLRLSESFHVVPSTIGWLMAAYFGGAACTSAVLGRLGQLLGARRQISLALLVSAGTQLSIAVVAESFFSMALLMVIAGIMNAANQSSVNLALTRAKLPRLGWSLAIKQSSMPFASVLAGIAVPAVALTIGWRYAFVGGAGVTLLALVWVRRVLAADTHGPNRTRSSAALTSRRRDLVMAGVVGLFLAFVAGALNAWTVASGVAAGISEGNAGLMLSLGAAAGIAMRLFWGTRLDAMPERQRWGPFWLAGVSTLVGAVGFALLGVRLMSETRSAATAHIAGTVLAFAGGWVWPVFTNFGIVRANHQAASAATGLSQTGVYLGLVLGPPVTGWIITSASMQAMWWVVAFMATFGALLSMRLTHRF